MLFVGFFYCSLIYVFLSGWTCKEEIITSRNSLDTQLDIESISLFCYDNVEGNVIYGFILNWTQTLFLDVNGFNFASLGNPNRLNPFRRMLGPFFGFGVRKCNFSETPPFSLTKCGRRKGKTLSLTR